MLLSTIDALFSAILARTKNAGGEVDGTSQKEAQRPSAAASPHRFESPHLAIGPQSSLVEAQG